MKLLFLCKKITNLIVTFKVEHFLYFGVVCNIQAFEHVSIFVQVVCAVAVQGFRRPKANKKMRPFLN